MVGARLARYDTRVSNPRDRRRWRRDRATIMRLGVFGGSFNPIHFGHLLLAEACRVQARLDEVWFVPAATPPHKQDHQRAPDADRLAMLRLAIGGHTPFQVSEIELSRGGVSYTVDTLREIHQRQPDAELFFLMGADSLADWSSWRSPDEICRLATPLVVRRAGSPEPALSAFEPFADQQQQERIAAHQVEMPIIELSSSAIRAAAAEGASFRFQTTRAVEKYIETQGLYRAG